MHIIKLFYRFTTAVRWQTVFAGLIGVTDGPTDRPTDYAIRSVAIDRIYM